MKCNDTYVEKRVLDKTANLILNKGIKGWNMDQLSYEIGLAKNTLYKIIGSKEALIEEVVLRFIINVQRQLVEIIKNEKDYITALEKIINLFPLLINNYYTGFMKEIFITYPSIEKSVRSHQDEITKSIINFIGKGMEDEIIKNDVTEEFTFEMFKALILHFIKSGAKDKELSEKLAVSFNCLINGIRKI